MRRYGYRNIYNILVINISLRLCFMYKKIFNSIYVTVKDIKSVSAEIKDGLLNIAYKYTSTDKEK